MGLAWTIVGLITGLSALAYVELAKRYRLDWKAWAGLIVGEALVGVGHAINIVLSAA
jgi:hypothetical protein